jgi:hypothetical protein
VKRLLAWLAGAVGGLAAYRAVKRPRPLLELGADARAEELRARLQQARQVGAEPLDPEAAGVDAGDLDPGARRAQVHEQGRAALDEMRGDQAP